MLNRRGFLAMSTVSLTSILAACSTGSGSDAGASASASAGSKGFPVEVKHAFGTTKVTKSATRVVTVGWGEGDIAAALGVVPVAAPAIVWGGNSAKSTDWFDAQVKKLGGKSPERFSDTDGTPVDKIAQYQPDLIIGTNSGLTKEQYDKLSQIAPTIAYKELPYGTSWEDSTTMIAAALGKKGEGEKLIAETKKKITDAVAKHGELEGKTASWVYFTPTNLNSVGIYTPIDARSRMLASFGTRDAAGVAKLTKDSKKFFIDLSAEKAPEIDSDIVIFDEQAGAEASKIVGNALLGKIPAIKAGSYVALKDLQASAAMSTPTPLSIPVALEKFLPKLAEAAKKSK